MAKKVHTRRKRKFVGIHIPRLRATRPKSFSTEEAAKTYAKQEGITGFTIRNLRLNPEAKGKYIVELK